MRVTGWVTPLRKGAIIYFVVFDRRGIAGAWSRKESRASPLSLALLLSKPRLPPPIYLFLFCVAAAWPRQPTAATCVAVQTVHQPLTPRLPTPLSPRNWLTSLFPTTTTTLAPPTFNQGPQNITATAFNFLLPPPSIIPLEFEVALHACWRSFLRCSPPQLVDSSGFFLFFLEIFR